MFHVKQFPMKRLSACPLCETREGLTHFLECRDHFLTGETFNIVECGSCGLKFTNPRPDDDELGKYYKSDDYLSHAHSSRNLLSTVYKFLRAYNLSRKYQHVISHSTNQGKILDIGAGTGEFLDYCKKKGWDTFGVEPSDNARNYATRAYQLKMVEKTDDPGLVDKFDVITLWHVLEHVPDLHEQIAQIKNLLKPDGTLILALPNFDSPDAKKYGAYWAAWDVPRHLYHFNQKSVLHLCNKFKFEPIEIIPMKLDAYYISLLSEKYKKGKSNYFSAAKNGFLSNNSARKYENNFSSLIFVLKPKC